MVRMEWVWLVILTGKRSRVNWSACTHIIIQGTKVATVAQTSMAAENWSVLKEWSVWTTLLLPLGPRVDHVHGGTKEMESAAQVRVCISYACQKGFNWERSVKAWHIATNILLRIVLLQWSYTPLISQQDGTLERGPMLMGHAGGLIVCVCVCVWEGGGGGGPCILPTLSLHA